MSTNPWKSITAISYRNCDIFSKNVVRDSTIFELNRITFKKVVLNIPEFQAIRGWAGAAERPALDEVDSPLPFPALPHLRCCVACSCDCHVCHMIMYLLISNDLMWCLVRDLSCPCPTRMTSTSATSTHPRPTKLICSSNLMPSRTLFKQSSAISSSYAGSKSSSSKETSAAAAETLNLHAVWTAAQTCSFYTWVILQACDPKPNARNAMHSFQSQLVFRRYHSPFSPPIFCTDDDAFPLQVDR